MKRKKCSFGIITATAEKRKTQDGGTGLFRYMTDQMAVQVLRDIADMKKGYKVRKICR